MFECQKVSNRVASANNDAKYILITFKQLMSSQWMYEVSSSQILTGVSYESNRRYIPSH